MKRVLSGTGWGVVSVLLSFVLTGCEESVSPVLVTEQPFTLYGLFNPTEDIQAVRVFPVEGRLELTEPFPIDAFVISTDLESGERVVWQDSVVQYQSRRFGHVFWAPFKAEFEHRYRLQVERSDEMLTGVEVTVPPFSEPEVLGTDPEVFELITPVLWRRAPNLINIRVRYMSNAGIYDIPYGVTQVTVDEGQLVLVNFREDTRQILRDGFLNGITDVEIFLVVVSAVVTNEEWVPPGGFFSSEIFVEPGTFSNIDNGFGFFGAGYDTFVEWVPPDSVLRAAGF